MTMTSRLVCRAALAGLAVLATGLGAPRDARAADTPETATAKRWALKFGHGPLKRVLVKEGADSKTLLYMTMTVENATGLPRDWRPHITGKVDSRDAPYLADGGFGGAIDKIRAVEHDDTLQPLETTGWKKGDDGKIATGQKLSLVAIFGPIDPQWHSFRVEVHGLVNPITTLKIQKYGEEQIVVDAAYADRNAKAWERIRAAAKASASDIPQPTSEYREVREKRAYVATYERAGDEFKSEDDLIQPKSEGWEVIGEPKLLPKPE